MVDGVTREEIAEAAQRMMDEFNERYPKAKMQFDEIMDWRNGPEANWQLRGFVFAAGPWNQEAVAVLKELRRRYPVMTR